MEKKEVVNKIEKRKLTMEEILRATAPLATFRTQKGIPFKTSYWLKRNFDKLISLERVFREKIQADFESQAEEVPSFKYVPAEKYPAFKAKIMKILNGEAIISHDVIQEILFTPYEIDNPNKGQKRLPEGKEAQFNENINKEAKEITEEIELYIIDIDEEIDAIFKTLPGVYVEALEFMFNTKGL